MTQMRQAKIADKTKKQTLSVTLIDWLSRNCMQTRTLQPTKMETWEQLSRTRQTDEGTCRERERGRNRRGREIKKDLVMLLWLHLVLDHQSVHPIFLLNHFLTTTLHNLTPYSMCGCCKDQMMDYRGIPVWVNRSQVLHMCSASLLVDI